MKPKFFDAFSYLLFGVSTLLLLISLSEICGLKILGDALYDSTAVAVIDFIINIWWLVAISMLIRKQKRGLAMFNASFGANILSSLKSSNDTWEILVSIAITALVFWFYNRSSVKSYLSTQ